MANGHERAHGRTPERNWTIHLVQHSHTDIGYTASQHEMLPAHLHYLDMALDCCDRTDGYPDEARFRWTCEAAWPVREYIRRRPSRQIDRLRARCSEGRIEPTALMFNMSEITPEAGLVASLQPIREINDALGIRIRTAMQNDVNGVAWAMADYLPPCGVRYLTMGVHRYRSVLPFKVPTAFWWESPSGSRMLAYRADHYLTGNWLGFNPESSLEHWISMGAADRPTPETSLAEYLASLEERGYPYSHLMVQYSGHETDNSHPSTEQCDLIRRWNETHDRIVLKSATAGEFLRWIEEHHGTGLPSLRVAWPDWWTDGFGSAARETGASRDAHAALSATNALLAMARVSGADIPDASITRLTETREQILFYDEHTFGSVDSVADPHSPHTCEQWSEKASYVWQGVQNSALVREEALGYLAPLSDAAMQPVARVYNTLNWTRTEPARLFIPFDVVPRGYAVKITDPDTGAACPAQVVCERPGDRPKETVLAYDRPAGRFVTFMAPAVPALGWKDFRIETGPEEDEDAPAEPLDIRTIENRWFSLALDDRTASVVSLRHRPTGRELVDTESQWRLGQVIFENFPVPEGACHDTGRVFRPEAFRRESARACHIERQERTALWQRVIFSCDFPGCTNPGGLRVEIRLWHEREQLDFVYHLRKEYSTSPEAVYVAFPFSGDGTELRYDGQGGEVMPGAGQVEGSSADWQTIQHYVRVADARGQTILSIPRVPLVQLGGLNLGAWQYVPEIPRPHVFSWVMNNYWWTNFRASQGGEWSWTCSLTSTEESSRAVAARFGAECHSPLIARLERVAKLETRSRILVTPGNVLAVEMRPERGGDGIILQLRELDGQDTTCRIEVPDGTSAPRMEEVDVTGRPLRPLPDPVRIPGFGVRFVRLALR
ncbi:MAG: hypothetical protein BWY06_02378 [Candidatus Latescibacteria bacterium ADurb.Bin168]|nr:MAG: hypothetical protein BWY06_02378 [Candidatus Latescibacteria bacterium ADurb.Bin168]